ncbi:hypothetical protein CHUAL_001297 [Chamberlinius hualienensis]
MALSGYGCFSKYFVFVFAILEIIFGIVIIAIGGVILTHNDTRSPFSSIIVTAGALNIVLGLIAIANGAFGSYGSIKENKTYIIVHWVLLVLAFVFLMINVIRAFAVVPLLWMLLDIARIVHVALLLHYMKQDTSVPQNLEA